MKKWCIVVFVLILMVLVISCASPKPIPPEAKSEIYSLSEPEAISEYVEVKKVQDRGDYCYIMMYIKSPLEEFTTMEYALPHAKRFTNSFIKEAVQILGKYDIDKDLSVWAQIPLEEGGVTILGHMEYDGEIYKDFELYEYE